MSISVAAPNCQYNNPISIKSLKEYITGIDDVSSYSTSPKRTLTALMMAALIRSAVK